MTKSVSEKTRRVCFSHCEVILAFVIAASFSSPSPESDTIPEEFTLSVTKFRKRFVHSLPLNIYMCLHSNIITSVYVSVYVCVSAYGWFSCMQMEPTGHVAPNAVNSIIEIVEEEVS
jgi:hypothetical protein